MPGMHLNTQCLQPTHLRIIFSIFGANSVISIFDNISVFFCQYFQQKISKNTDKSVQLVGGTEHCRDHTHLHTPTFTHPPTCPPLPPPHPPSTPSCYRPICNSAHTLFRCSYCWDGILIAGGRGMRRIRNSSLASMKGAAWLTGRQY